MNARANKNEIIVPFFAPALIHVIINAGIKKGSIIHARHHKMIAHSRAKLHAQVHVQGPDESLILHA